MWKKWTHFLRLDSVYYTTLSSHQSIFGLLKKSPQTSVIFLFQKRTKIFHPDEQSEAPRYVEEMFTIFLWNQKPQGSTKLAFFQVDNFISLTWKQKLTPWIILYLSEDFNNMQIMRHTFVLRLQLIMHRLWAVWYVLQWNTIFWVLKKNNSLAMKGSYHPFICCWQLYLIEVW